MVHVAFIYIDHVLGEKIDGSFRQATGRLASFHGAQGVKKNSKMEGRQPIEVGSLAKYYLQGFIICIPGG